MKLIFPMMVIAAALMLSGCASPSTQPVVIAEPVVTPAPVGPAQGKVVVVNPDHRFVVLDFGQYPIPAVGVEIELYRESARIGRLRLTEPRRGRLISADVLQGEPRVGDTAR